MLPQRLTLDTLGVADVAASRVSDPDGHLWEVTFNPFWPLDASGRSHLLSPAPGETRGES